MIFPRGCIFTEEVSFRQDGEDRSVERIRLRSRTRPSLDEEAPTSAVRLGVDRLPRLKVRP